MVRPHEVIAIRVHTYQRESLQGCTRDVETLLEVGRGQIVQRGGKVVPAAQVVVT